MFSVVNLCLLTSFHVQAGDCRAIYKQETHSSGVTVKENNCSQSPYLSTKSVIELAPKGRLWLKSIASEYVKSSFQLICQNELEHSVQLEFSDMLSPWLNVSKLGHCSGWVNHKLNCKITKSGQKGLYCVLSQLKEKTMIKPASPERTTSLRMREIKKLTD